MGASMTSLFEYDGGSIIDFTFVTKVLNNASMIPFWDQIMATEATRVAQIRHCITALGVPQKCIVHCKTDCLNVQCDKNVSKKHKEGLMALAEITYADLPKLRERFGPKGQKFLDCLVPLAGVADQDCVFKTGTGKPLKAQYKEPDLPAHPVAAMPDWVDITPEAAMERVNSLKSLLVLGAPGTGKTHWAQQRVQELRAAKKKVVIVTKCHNAVANFGYGAMTLDHFCYKYIKNGSCSADIIFLEELTQTNAYLFDELAKLLLKGIPIVLLGDWAQYQAIMDTISGCKVDPWALERSDLIRELAGFTRVTMVQNMRSDPPLFDYFCGLSVGAPDENDLEDALERGRGMFPVTGGPADYTLVISHKRRKQINQAMNEMLKPEHAVLFEKQPMDAKEEKRLENQQSFYAWEGMRLLGAGAKCKKNVFHTVVAVSDDELTVAYTSRNDQGLEKETLVTLTPEMALKSLRPCWALTYASVQGATLRGRVRLEDTTHKNFNIRHLYVGASRATAASLLEIV
jgi:hypothetical protein